MESVDYEGIWDGIMVQHDKPALMTTHVQLRMYVVAARQLSPPIKGKNGSLIKQPAAAFKGAEKSALLALLQRWGPVERVQVLGGDKPSIPTHFKGFFNSQRKKKMRGISAASHCRYRNKEGADGEEGKPVIYQRRRSEGDSWLWQHLGVKNRW